MPFSIGHKAPPTAFKKGQTPWNKGLKRVHHYCQKCNKELRVKNKSMLCQRCVKLGRKASNKTRALMSEAAKKRGFTAEHKRNISIAKMGAGNAMYGKKHTAEHRAKIGAAHKGEKHWNWKGDKTPENVRIRNSDEYKAWRLAVYQRDRFSCINCGYRSRIKGDIRADHIKPFSLYPELRLDLSNGRTLCIPCDKLLGWSFFRENNPRKKPVII